MAGQLLVAQPRGRGARLNGGLRDPADIGPGADPELYGDSAPADLGMVAAELVVSLKGVGLIAVAWGLMSRPAASPHGRPADALVD